MIKNAHSGRLSPDIWPFELQHYFIQLLGDEALKLFCHPLNSLAGLRLASRLLAGRSERPH